MTYKSTFLTAFIISLILFGLWTTLLFTQPTLLSNDVLASLPDGTMEDAFAIVIDKQGHPKMKISTPRMVHYAEQDTSNLTTPHFVFYRQSPEPWHVTSKHAKAVHGADDVYLWDNVVVRHPGDKRQPSTLIKTEKLTVHTAKETAETEELITMIRPNFIIRGIGMFADMTKGDIHLFSNVRGEYVPT